MDTQHAPATRSMVPSFQSTRHEIPAKFDVKPLKVRKVKARQGGADAQEPGGSSEVPNSSQCTCVCA